MQERRSTASVHAASLWITRWNKVILPGTTVSLASIIVISSKSKVLVLLSIAFLVLVSGCTRMPRTGMTALKPETLSELQRYLLAHKADLEHFRLRGPFTVDQRKNLPIRLASGELVETDLYLSVLPEKAPLVVFLHGYERSKEDHAYQAMHVATWGMHGLSVQLPNTGPWVGNGRTLAKIVDAIQRNPGIVDRRVDAGRIILVGYSFGGTAVAVAMADGAAVAGGILLDPAGIGKDLPKFLGQVRRPVMLLGADERISETRNRDYFYRFVAGGFFEISIKDAVHDDAQFPAEVPLFSFAGDASGNEDLQITFVSALTASAFSLAATGKLDYAWASFGEALKNGSMISPRRK